MLSLRYILITLFFMQMILHCFRKSIKNVVIEQRVTHKTDTHEELTYFLHLYRNVLFRQRAGSILMSYENVTGNSNLSLSCKYFSKQT